MRPGHPARVASPPLMLDFPLAAPIHALPLDIMRVLGGSVLFIYFLQALRQSADFSDPNGLIDHGLSARLFPPTRLSLFQPGMPGTLFRVAFLCACIASLFVVAGYHPRASAAFLFLVAVSTYRWNVLAAYLDDAMVHIFCLWLALLPVGHTLTLAGLLDTSAPTGEWLAATVPGTAPRAFMANMALVYLVAGLYKFTSPMWRDGSAMHAALKMQISRAPHFWTTHHRALLRVVTHAALILEPLCALVFVLPAHSLAKWLLVAGAATFHLGIIATLKIPYSNAVMLTALPVALTPEIMQGLGFPLPEALVVPGLAPTEVIALTLVALLVIMSVWQAVRAGVNLPKPGMPYTGSRWENPVRALLWLAGIFQSYRLFDWVDARNYHVRYEVRRIVSSASTPADAGHGGRSETAGRSQPVDPLSLFPNSMRHLLLQSYLVGNIWLQMGPGSLEEIRRSLILRHARRYARAHPDAGTIEAVAVVQRITGDNLDLTKGERQLLMRFTCQGGEAVMLHPR